MSEEADHAPKVYDDAADRKCDRPERIAVLTDALTSAQAWLERWATHVGSCPGGNGCSCGLSFIRNEVGGALQPEEECL